MHFHLFICQMPLSKATSDGEKTNASIQVRFKGLAQESSKRNLNGIHNFQGFETCVSYISGVNCCMLKCFTRNHKRMVLSLCSAKAVYLYRRRFEAARRRERESFTSCYCLISLHFISMSNDFVNMLSPRHTLMYDVYIVRKDLKLSQFAYLCAHTCYFERISTFTLRWDLDAVLETVKMFRVQSCTLSMVPSFLRKGRGGTTNLDLFRSPALFALRFSTPFKPS